MYYVIFFTICALMILLGFEIRHRVMTEEVSALKDKTAELEEEITRLKAEMKLKKNIYEENAPPS